MGELIKTAQLTKTYGAGEATVYALNDVTLSVSAGEFFAIMGPSGCGKSTLLNMFGALDQPTSGEVWVAGENLAQLKSVDHFRRTIGFVFQLHNLLPTLTALENVETPMIGQGLGRRQRLDRAGELLALVGLSDRQHHMPGQLSGGQRQRVAIARTGQPTPTLLADEPTGALDSQSGAELLALLADLNRTHGTTIAVVTHDRRVAQATQRILRMQDGRIIDDHCVTGPLEEDLRMLAQSHLGQALLNENAVPPNQLTPAEAEALRGLLRRLQ